MIRELDLPVPLTPRSPIVLRRARSEDVDAVIALLADDAISSGRGDQAAPEDRPAYVAGFEQITADPSNELVVAEDESGRLVAMLQLTSIPGMARRGATRLLIEAVRVRSDLRSGGIGTAAMRWVMDVAAPAVGAGLVQLTSDANRPGAHRFYERLGFTGSHVGFKYRLESPSA